LIFVKEIISRKKAKSKERKRVEDVKIYRCTQEQQKGWSKAVACCQKSFAPDFYAKRNFFCGYF
jgi:hypothetical protein